MIYDCFPFFNEYDILELRIKELYDVVDYFVIVEGTHTHKGVAKEANYLKNKERYAAYSSKIKFFYMDNLVDIRDPWAQEKKQRNNIYHALVELNAQPDDLIIVSDADEIVSPNLIIAIEQSGYKTTINDKVVHIAMTFYNYDYETFIQRPWGSAYMCLFSTIEASYNKTYNSKVGWHFSDARFMSENLISGTGVAGWHFSFFGDINKIREKLANYAHQEFNTEQVNNVDYILECILSKKAIEQGDQMVHVPLEKNRHNLPKNIDVLVDALAKNKESILS